MLGLRTRRKRRRLRNWIGAVTKASDEANPVEAWIKAGFKVSVRWR